MKVCCRLQKVQSVPGLLSGIVYLAIDVYTIETSEQGKYQLRIQGGRGPWSPRQQDVGMILPSTFKPIYDFSYLYVFTQMAHYNAPC